MADCQDWDTVTLNKPKAPNHNKSGIKKVKEGGEEDIPIKKNLPKDFGKKMHQARLLKGWTQKELAQKLNCKLSEIQDYEQNRVTHPNRSFARKIEKVLQANLFKYK